MSDLLKDTWRKRRRQSAIQLRRLSMPSPAADEAQITLAAEDLIQASRACYRIIFLLAAVRLGATLIDDNIWSKLFDPNRPISAGNHYHTSYYPFSPSAISCTDSLTYRTTNLNLQHWPYKYENVELHQSIIFIFILFLRDKYFYNNFYQGE